MALLSNAPRHPPSLRRRTNTLTSSLLTALRVYRDVIAPVGFALVVVAALYYGLLRRTPPTLGTGRAIDPAAVAPIVVAERRENSDVIAGGNRLGAPPPAIPHEPRAALAGVPKSAKEWQNAQPTKVSCGAHFAPSCKECPQGHGEGYCHGDCRWDAAEHECFEPPSLVHPAYKSLVNDHYSFQPVRADDGRYVNIILVRAPFRSSKGTGEWEAVVKYKDDILFVGISSFESFPLSSPNPFSSNYSDSLYTSMFPGFLHMMHEPEKHFPPHVKTLLLSQSDFELPGDEPLAATDAEHHMYDFSYSGGNLEVNKGCVGWASFAKNWSFVLEALDVMCSDEFNLRGVLVGSRDKSDTMGCEIPPKCKGKMTQTTFLKQDKFFNYMKRSRFAFVPQIYDASPRVIPQSFSLDVPVLMNKHILGGWKYVNEETGEFFSDISDFKESLRRILDGVKKKQYHPRRWIKEHYGNEHAGKVFLDWVKEHFADRVDIPEGTKYLVPTGA